MITFTSFATQAGGAAVFTWLEESDPVCVPFIESLDSIPDENIAGALLRYMFEFSENVHIAPQWWEGLHFSQRNALIRRFRLSMKIDASRPKNVLGYDGVGFGAWPIRGRYRIGF